jgi:ATP synthase protein I
MTQPSAQHPALNYDEVRRAGERSRAGGPWSVEHLRLCWLTLLAAGAVLVIVLVFTMAGRDVAGAAVGIGIVGLFFSLSTLVIAAVGRRAPGAVLVTALGTYLLKIVILGIVIITIPADGPIAPRWMAIGVVIGLVAWMGAHLRYIWTTKMYYVDPS